MLRSDTRALAPLLLGAWIVAALVIAPLLSCRDEDPLEHVRELQAEGRLQESLEPLRALLVARPESPEVHYRYGLALARGANPGMAVWSLRKAESDPKWGMPASLELARAAMRSENWASAIESATRVLDQDEDNVAALAIRAEAYLGRLTEPELALADLDRAIELAPDEPGYVISRARALLMADRVDEAQELVGRLETTYGEKVSKDPTLLGPLCVLRAVFAKDKGDSDAAEVELNDCLDRYPANATVLHSAIDYFDEQGEFDHGTALLRRALEKAPNSIRYRTALGSRLRQLGKPEEGEAILRAGLALGRRDIATEMWTALARHYAELGQLPEAAHAYGRAIELAPEVSEVGWLTYADMLAAADEPERALEVAERLETPFYRKLVEGHVALNRGEPAKALQLLDDVLLHWPNNAGAHYYTALAAEQLGDFDRAIEEYRHAIRSDAALTDAGIRLAELMWAMGDEQSAWTAASHHRKAQPTDPRGHLLMVRIAAAGGSPTRLRNLLREVSRTIFWQDAVAIHSDAIARRAGPAAAVERIRKAPGIDLADPRSGVVLHALIRHLHAKGDEESAAQAAALVAAARKAHPEDARFLALGGIERGLAAGDPAAGRAELEQALAIDPEQLEALEAMGAIALAEGDPARAASYFERAAAIDPSRADLSIAAARAATASSTPSDARQRWLDVQREFPWSPQPLMELARLALDRGDPERALELAQRATRFRRGGSEARELVEAAQEALGQSEPAS